MAAAKLCIPLSHLLAFAMALGATAAVAAPLEPVRSLAAAEKAPLIETLKGLVGIESGSGDREGLDRIAEVIAGRLKGLGGAVEMIEPESGRYLSHGRYAQADRPDGKGDLHRHRHAQDHADRPHGHRLPARHAGAASRSASMATAPTGSASPTTSTVSR